MRGPPPPKDENANSLLTQTGGSLEAVNDIFHDAYDTVRSQEKHDGPVFVVLADEIVVLKDGKRTALSFSPSTYHALKAVSHAPVALYAAWLRGARGASRWDTLRTHVLASRHQLSLEERGGSQAHYAAIHLLDRCITLLNRVPSQIGRQEIDAFAREVGPVLLQLAKDATRLQLDALHTHTEYALSMLDEDERSKLEVVVAGAHQARARSLAMQYFKKRLGDPPNVERRVAFGEGISDEKSAVELVGTRRLDRELAHAFFGDPHRLQRDVLGDAASDLLAEWMPESGIHAE